MEQPLDRNWDTGCTYYIRLLFCLHYTLYITHFKAPVCWHNFTGACLCTQTLSRPVLNQQHSVTLTSRGHNSLFEQRMLPIPPRQVSLFLFFYYRSFSMSVNFGFSPESLQPVFRENTPICFHLVGSALFVKIKARSALWNFSFLWISCRLTPPSHSPPLF